MQTETTRNKSRKMKIIFCPVLLTITIILGTLCSQVSTGYQVEEVKIDFSKNPKIFTAEEISKYDGSDENLPVYMAIKGVVFDVSSGRGFYGKGAPYNALVGKDATRGVAKMSLEPEDLVPDISGLSEDSLRSLDTNFRETYMRKYDVVGYMDSLVEDIKAERDETHKEL